MSEQPAPHDIAPHDIAPQVMAPPRALRIIGVAALTTLLVGAFYIIWVRGEAITVDLATLAGKMWCF